MLKHKKNISLFFKKSTTSDELLKVKNKTDARESTFWKKMITEFHRSMQSSRQFRLSAEHFYDITS